MEPMLPEDAPPGDWSLPEIPDRPKGTTCMICFTRVARYYGSWAEEEGVCRHCMLEMEPEIRFKVVRDMYPHDRQRWQDDNRLDPG